MTRLARFGGGICGGGGGGGKDDCMPGATMPGAALDEGAANLAFPAALEKLFSVACWGMPMLFSMPYFLQTES